uniref:Uncharacterized protein n=1 Tax=Biomphalaria glabrata TaxID=6526 RepID=A0A2C9LZN6_BIOGL
MAGDSETKTNGFYSDFSFESNARRFKTNFDSIYEKYQRPFLDDDLVELKNLTIKKDNGFLQIKKSVLFGAVKLKCARSKGTFPDNKALEETFTIDKNVSMAIERECGSLFGGTEPDDDDEDAETLSPVSSEDEEEEEENSSECDGCDFDSDSSLKEGSSYSEPWDSSSENSDNSTEDLEEKALNETFNIIKVSNKEQNRECQKCQQHIFKATPLLSSEARCNTDPKSVQTLVKPFFPGRIIFSPKLPNNRPCTSKSNAESPLKKTLNSTFSPTLDTSISSSLNDLKLVSLSSPLKSETLNSSRGSSKLSASHSSFASPVNTTIASSFGDLTLVSLSSPEIKPPRNNKSIDKLLSTPQSQQRSSKNDMKDIYISNFTASRDQRNVETCFKSPTTVKRRIITTKVDCFEKRPIPDRVITPVLQSQNDKLKSTCQKLEIKKMSEIKKTESMTPRDLKLSEFSTSDYFTDSSSPRKVPNHVHGHCDYHLISLDTNTTKPHNFIDLHNFNHQPTTVNCLTKYLEHLKSSHYLKNANCSESSHYLKNANCMGCTIKEPITIEGNKFRKRLQLKRDSICLQKSLLSNYSLPQSSCSLSSTDDFVSGDESKSSTLTDIATEEYSSKDLKSTQQVGGCKCNCGGKTKIVLSKNASTQVSGALDQDIVNKHSETLTILPRNMNMETFTVSDNHAESVEHLPRCSFPITTISRNHKIITEWDWPPSRPTSPLTPKRKKKDKHTEPLTCSCQNSSASKKSESAMFTEAYINKFCPKNPFRIDSDSPVHNGEKPFLSFQKSLKAFRPLRNSTKLADVSQHRDVNSHPKQDKIFMTDIHYHQKPPKLRKISSSKLSLRKLALPNIKLHSKTNRKRMMNSSNLPATQTFFPLRASTPFGEMSILDSTISTIVEPSVCSETTSEDHTDLDTTRSLSLDDDVALLC